MAPSGAYITDGVTYEPVGTFSTGPTTHAAVNATGATAAQLQQALDESGLSVNGSGIKVGVLSDSFNDLGGAAADEADGALPSASDIDVIKDLASGGTDEGRAMMQIIHDIAPSSSLAFYTAFDSEQDFANGILALAAAGAKVIVDDVSYFDEPFFQNGVVAQAIQTVEAEGVVYVTAAGNDASNAYQAAWSALSGTYDGVKLTDAESFGGSLVQTVGANSSYDVPLLLEWNQAYGAATSDLEILVFENGRLVGTATNRSVGEPTNPWTGIDLPGGATYQIAIENLSGPNPGLVKEITEGDGLPVTISGANVGTVYGHAMTVGAITAGAVSAADTPAFGFSTPLSESYSSSGAGTELLFANNGAALSSPQALSPVAVSGVDDIHTTVSDLSDFYGTSAAAASLAGVAALVLSADPSLTPAQVEQILEATALPMGNSAVSGAGLVQVDPAVADALNDLATAPPRVTSDTVSGTGISNGAGKLKLGQTAVLTLAMSQAVTVAGGTPTLALNDGGVATYNASQSTATSLAFDYTVAAGQYAAALAVTGVNLDGATVANSGGTAANLAGADTTFSSLLVDGITPAVTAETVSGSGISAGAGTLMTGAAVVLTLAMSEAVTVTGGVPTLTLNDGGTATYDAAHSTSTSLAFDYTVAAGQYANALAVTGINLHGAAVADVAGNAANFAGANATFSHLLVDATTPVVTAANAHDVLAGSVSVPHAQAATAGVLAGDSDADPSDTLSVSAVAGSAGNVGHAVAGAYGALTLNSDGSYAYTNTNSAAVTAASGVAEDIFNFTVGNGHGGSANATLTVLITSPGETYVAAASGGTIAAGNGAYVLDGSAGNVTATAGGGAAQWLIAGPGDTLNAGSTADTFLFEPGFGKVTVDNFNTAQDVIDLPQSLFANFAAVQADMHASGANTIIELDANDMITLSHVAAANLHAQNFHFVV
jgi:VCBS repeat-containing protein